jgi:hydrogenase nickel incorporation protein HypA/HybF
VHELHLAQDVLQKILAEASKSGLNKISNAKVSIGETLITDPPEFEEIFADIAKGTPAEGVDLNVAIRPLLAVCGKCHQDFDSAQLRFDCPHCGSLDVKLTSGTEIEIVDLK